jgi:hypothetical protein
MITSPTVGGVAPRRLSPAPAVHSLSICACAEHRCGLKGQVLAREAARLPGGQVHEAAGLIRGKAPVGEGQYEAGPGGWDRFRIRVAGDDPDGPVRRGRLGVRDHAGPSRRPGPPQDGSEGSFFPLGVTPGNSGREYSNTSPTRSHVRRRSPSCRRALGDRPVRPLGGRGRF